MAKKKAPVKKTVENIKHADKRKNIPTAEFQSVMKREHESPLRVAYERRNRDLDPQLVWRGKDEQDWSDLVVHAPPLYIQEKVQPKALIDDLLRQTAAEREAADKAAGKMFQLDMFADFNGIPEGVDKTDFYQHDQNWSNRMILGDSLQVMASLAEREGLRGKVQCIYIDPPYGIKFNSNFQWSTTSRDVKDGKADHVTREPEQVKAFRDTWRDGIHSYLTYLRDRLTVARDLLTDSGSIFVQIGDENVHRVRALMDEVFGSENCISAICFKKTSGAGSPAVRTDVLPSVFDQILWYAKSLPTTKYRQPFSVKDDDFSAGGQYSKVELKECHRRPMTSTERADRATLPADARIYRHDTLTSQSAASTTKYTWAEQGSEFTPTGYWKTPATGMARLSKSWRLGLAKNSLSYIRFIDDFPVSPISNLWTDTLTGSFTEEKVYVVQTSTKIIQRCILMATDPGDLVLDPTCGSGTTAYVAEQWGRRWITIDTSRVALALARARVMGARYPYYMLADSPEGRKKKSEERNANAGTDNISPLTLPPSHFNIRHGFVYERVPHITLKSIANNAEIDVIWEKHQLQIAPLLKQMKGEAGREKSELGREKSEGRRVKGEKESHSSHFTLQTFEEWQIPRECPTDWPESARSLHEQFWQAYSGPKKLDHDFESNPW